MIRRCADDELDKIYSIINEAAIVYKGAIPEDCWHEPYMSRRELAQEIDKGVMFWGFEEAGELIGVMGIQHVLDVTLIRHAYVRTASQHRGVGGELLTFLRGQTARPVLIGTWADALWAIAFYEKHGFRGVSREEKDELLKRYWSISERQIETSVVLADRNWRDGE